MVAGYTCETIAIFPQTRQVDVGRPEDALPILRPLVRDWLKEHFLLICLSARNTLLSVDLVSLGSLSASIVHPREVFKPAFLASAAGVIVAHNHPSGDPEPSPEDVAVTRRLQDVGTMFGVELLDHIVFTPDSFVSMKGRGHL